MAYDRGRGVLPRETPFACWLWHSLAEMGVWPLETPVEALPLETWLELRYLQSTAVPFRHDYARTLVELLQAFFKPS